ncbi:amidase [Amorphus orientalis]|uniref:Amidase n=1 Tax=Amorphus orientalis TaxID=649198 RepID=A0AAE4AS08_9HYPH|nr:amidase [Amorphus orientalis]MDQ0314475.1 amidase [Amorphus orientalis]
MNFKTRVAAKPSDDTLGAYCPDNQIALTGSGTGPLAGLSFAAKDVLDVAGAATGNGHPEWLRTHAPAERSAVAVERVLAAGADLVGKTISDELAYSLTGENFHYGTPINPADPSRVPGGSSSGSASVVAAGVVDFALGTDCGGSVRVPASYCGILGMRPTHGRIPLDGVVPFAPSFDCVGWFARDAGVLERVGRVLLADDGAAQRFTRLLVPSDAFAMLDADFDNGLLPAVDRVAAEVASKEPFVLAEEGLEVWSESFRIVQASEIWKSVGAWIDEVRPSFGPGVKERFEAARHVDPDLLARAQEHRREITARIDALLTAGTVMVLPTVPRTAPARGGDMADIEVAYRHKAMNLLCVAGLAGLPQISLPLARHGHLPLGLSIVGARGSDVDLLGLSSRLASR